MLTRLSWYAARMRAMSPGEIAWRAGTVVDGWVLPDGPVSDKRQRALIGEGGVAVWRTALEDFRAGKGRPTVLEVRRAAALSTHHPEQTARVLDAADAVRHRRFSFFGRPEVELDDPVDWHRDPISGHAWPVRSARLINHRHEPADAKVVWELNRLQHLVWLAEAWLITGDERFASSAFDQLASWLEKNPPGMGIAWRGAFEAGVRATSVAIALHGLSTAPGLSVDLFRRTVLMLADSADRCWRGRSRFSSANNHVVGELVGMLTVALLFPGLPGARRWTDCGVRALAAEERQILADGAGAEQSLAYHVYTADLFCLAVVLLERSGRRAPSRLVEALRRSSQYLGHLLGGDDDVPHYGDDDGGFALRLDATPVRTARAHLATVSAVLGESVPGAGEEDLYAGWLRTDSGAARPMKIPAARSSFYADKGGLVVLDSANRRITMDVGPLGYLALAAHGHADALSVTVRVGGVEVVTDPGTASYYGNPTWRAEHRGTAMHATVSVDDLDQSVPAGSFLWSRHARVDVRRVDLSLGFVCAEHDGYVRLKEPVLHRRWLHAPPDGGAILVLDLLQTDGEHAYTVSWPLHPDVQVSRNRHGCRLEKSNGFVCRVTMACPEGAEQFSIRGVPGEGTAVGGWWSDRLEHRVPAWRIGSQWEGRGPAVFATLFETVETAMDARLTVENIGTSAVRVSWLDGGVASSILVDPEGYGEPRLERES